MRAQPAADTGLTPAVVAVDVVGTRDTGYGTRRVCRGDGDGGEMRACDVRWTTDRWVLLCGFGRADGQRSMRGLQWERRLCAGLQRAHLSLRFGRICLAAHPPINIPARGQALQALEDNGSRCTNQMDLIGDSTAQDGG